MSAAANGPLAGKVAVVTGASSGIGAATARAMAAAGMRVALSARRADRLEALVRELKESGADALAVPGDVAAPGAAVQLLDAVERRYGAFDVVFANAGYGAEQGILEMSEAQLRRMFEVNFFAATDLLRVAAGRLLAAGRPGHLLMCSSCLAKFTLPYYGAYAATKAAQAMVARSLRFELEPHGIQVSSVHPITTVTEFFETAAVEGGRSANGSAVPTHAKGPFVQPPERVARAVMSCLRKPRSEVWTSTVVRLSAGLLNAFPSVLDAVLRREARRTRASHGGGG